MQNKVIIVTGAASGMGKATALKLHDLGAKVYACDVNIEGLKSLTEGRSIQIMRFDISYSNQCDDLVGHVYAEEGRLDGLVNFAGVIKRTSIMDCTDEEFDFVMRVNAFGSFYLARAAAKVMLPQGRGSIVNVSSIWSTVGAPGVLAYCASKGAVSQITRSAALDLAGTGVRVNELRPGETNTPMLGSERDKDFSPEDVRRKLEEIAATIPEKRLANPEEMANAAIFLLSDESAYMQGSQITVDGGYSAQ